MASLRARLLVALLALSALALLVVGAITYTTQRNFLYDRVDEQTRQAVPAVAHALAEQGIGPPIGDGDHGRSGRPPDGDGPLFGLPGGVYGERISPSGAVLGSVVPYDQADEHPAIPANLRPGFYATVGGRGDDEGRYRVLAARDPAGYGLTVVALPLHETDATLHRLLLVEALVIAGVLALLGLVSWFVVRVGLRPLDRIGLTAGAIAAGDLSRRVSPADPRTEVGRLGIALNAMLDRLEDAFAERRASESRLRRFLADASHELRTPLASIRGYAELFRMGATESPEELEKAMRRIEDEAARMGVLVEDLLTLARLDQTPDARHEPVDASALAADAVDDARATAPDRTISALLEPGLVVLGDANGLRQVLGNLLRNALVHTPDGTPVEVGTAREDGWVRIDVRDHGPGLPEGDPAALFERFWRAEGGRERGRAGAGLGLAIVAGIVDAHGGEVQAANAPGGGARFTVRLPA
jgi:two-component system, OmpR family, sensor kinase